jgi:tetratricopeptide (TPR) repeat protein
MLNWFKKNKAIAKSDNVVTEMKEQSQTVAHSSVNDIVNAGQVNNSFNKKTEIHHHHYPEKPDKQFNADISRLPKPATNQFIGRKTELEILHQTFNNRAQTGIVAIIADGGIGKSALTDEWITDLKKTSYGGIKRVFAWSFYSQGSHQNTFSSSQDFFTHALPFFGFDKDLPQDDVEKARTLAQCLTQQAGLLLLDGLEPLQHPVDQQGEMADVGMKEFLLQLHHHRHAQSFVLISSRQAIVELNGREDYQELVLNTLNETDGAALLQALKVTGTNAERQAVSRDLHGHALSLVLLAELLRHYHKGDIRYARELPPLVSEDEDDRPASFPKPPRSVNHEHAKRVLSYYDKLISDNERRFMVCLSLFDRPMRWQEKRALFAKAEYAAPLAALSDSDWQDLQAGLEAKGLLLGRDAIYRVCSDKINQDAINRVSTEHRTHWDTHPLIRQFFATQFKQQQPDAFQQAHRVLFEYFQTVPTQHQPDTLAELEPLYRAVLHGCLAGEYQKALVDVYQQSIRRGDEDYSLHKLGAYSQDLIALSAFFPRGWSERLSSGLSEADQAWLLANASFCLMSLGRLAEAVAPYEAATNLYEKLEDWKNTEQSPENLTDLLLPLGKLADAKTATRQAIDYALRTENKFRQMAGYSKLATVLHRQGFLSTAQEMFTRAEQLQAQRQPEYPYLYALQGAQYCALLLDTAHQPEDLAAILTRAEYALKLSTQYNSLLAIAFDHLTLAHTYSALKQTDTARTAFTAAILAIQKSGSVMDMPQFYLARASFHLSQNELVKAKDDIDTANQTITRCGMKLYAVDAALLLGRYYLAMNDKTSAQRYYDQAEMLIVETGYHLRDKDLAELKRAL